MAEKSSALNRAGPWLAGVVAVGLLAWLGWYGYDEQRATTRGLHVIGLLRDVQTCVGLSYEANRRQLVQAGEFENLPQMKATPYASTLVWDAVSLRATATFAGAHPDYDGRKIWTAASIGSNGALTWQCGSDVAPSARSYGNVATFIQNCNRPLQFDAGIAEYCRRFVPLPAR